MTLGAANAGHAFLAWDMMASALFLLVSLAIVATRQMLAGLRLFILQSCLLALSATLIGVDERSVHLLVVAGISIAAKAVGIPWLLKATLREELYGRREIDQALTIPTSLILAAGLVLFGFFLFGHLFGGLATGYAAVNLPVGIACVLLGVFTVTVRREALAQLMGLLAMENAVFFAGISIAPHLSLLAEIAAAIDVPAMALVIGLLIRQIHRRLGTTRVGELAALKEQ